MPRFVPGTAVKLNAIIRDEDQQLADPTWIKVGAVDANANSLLAATTMTKDTTGVYYHDWQTSTTSPKGEVLVTTTASCGGKTIINAVTPLVFG